MWRWLNGVRVNRIRCRIAYLEARLETTNTLRYQQSAALSDSWVLTSLNGKIAYLKEKLRQLEGE